MPDDLRAALLAAFDAELRQIWRTDLRSVLEGLENVLVSSRYPFEHGHDITQYNLNHLVGLAGFLRRFVRTLPATDRITWKTA